MLPHSCPTTLAQPCPWAVHGRRGAVRDRTAHRVGLSTAPRGVWAVRWGARTQGCVVYEREVTRRQEPRSGSLSQKGDVTGLVLSGQHGKREDECQCRAS